MSYPRSSLLSLFLLLTILMTIAGLAAAGRNIPAAANANDDDLKQPEFLLKHDGSFLIPGFGRVYIPKKHHYFPTKPVIIGGGGVAGAGGANGGYLPGGGASGGYLPGGGTSGGYLPGGGTSGGYLPGGGANSGYLPGGDDTFVPNPGFEVPNPVGGNP